MNKENLILLADYLEKLPEDYGHFGMHTYNGDGKPHELGHQCGTVACALGHAPYVKGLPVPLYDEFWGDYCERVLGIDSVSFEWDWCFDANWVYKDNTPQGAAKRIKYLVEKGLPDNWYEQLNGRAELCYKQEE